MAYQRQFTLDLALVKAIMQIRGALKIPLSKFIARLLWFALDEIKANHAPPDLFSEAPPSKQKRRAEQWWAQPATQDDPLSSVLKKFDPSPEARARRRAAAKATQAYLARPDVQAELARTWPETQAKIAAFKAAQRRRAPPRGG